LLPECVGEWVTEDNPVRVVDVFVDALDLGALYLMAGVVAEGLGARAAGKPIEIRFQDEAKVGQQGTQTRIWARRGTRPRATRDQRFNWAYLLVLFAWFVVSAPLWSCLPSTSKP
jgi:hypothetical protein